MNGNKVNSDKHSFPYLFFLSCYFDRILLGGHTKISEIFEYWKACESSVSVATSFFTRNVYNFCSLVFLVDQGNDSSLRLLGSEILRLNLCAAGRRRRGSQRFATTLI